VLAELAALNARCFYYYQPFPTKNDYAWAAQDLNIVYEGPENYITDRKWYILRLGQQKYSENTAGT
jgi:hypothetical protein